MEEMKKLLVMLHARLAVCYFRWARSRRWGRVHGSHPDAFKVGSRLKHYERLLQRAGVDH